MDNYFKGNLTSEEENSNIKGIKHNLKSEEGSDEHTIKFLIEGLCDENGLVRRSHSKELANIGKAALPKLINALLNSENVIQRRAAAKTLKLIEDPLALPHLIKALTNDSDPVVQFSAAGAIAIFGEDAVNHLINVLDNHKHTEMQYGLATWCLEFIGSKAANAIKKAAKSKNSNVKSAAITALEDHIRQSQDQEAIQIVKSAINHSTENVQIEAIKLVGKLYRIDSFIPILISKLRNKSPDIRKATIMSLMQLQIKESLDELKCLLKVEQDKDIRRIIILAIEKIHNKTYEN